MAVFEFKGLTAAGKPTNGLKEAESAKALRALLRKDGIFLTDVVGQADGGASKVGRGKTARGPGQLLKTEVNFKKLGRGKPSTEDIAVMTRQLATLLGAGVTLVEALAAMVDQVENELLKRILSDVKQHVNEGSSLADALAQHSATFGTLYVNMIRAGETSGALDSVLVRLAEFTESQAELRGRLIGAMIYPIIMVVIGGGVLVMMMTFVVPSVAKIFESMKATLPFSTRLLIWMSDVIRNFWFVIFPTIFGGAYALFWWTQSASGKPVWDRLALKLPLFGNVARLLAMARFARTLATLLKSGVPLLNALDIVQAIMTNSVLAKVIDQARDSIREGESISAPLKRSGEFPPLVYHMIAIGERSGQLEDMLLNVASSYENQTRMRIDALMALLSPIMIVIMAGFVGFVAISILNPMLKMNTLFSR
jgi:general secretion pathway protein F